MLFLGDPRNNQHFGLILYEETFLRFHNHIAKLLNEKNPDWTDEILFEEARRFLIAVYQIIIYRDYLPLLLGRFILGVTYFKYNFFDVNIFYCIYLHINLIIKIYESYNIH